METRQETKWFGIWIDMRHDGIGIYYLGCDGCGEITRYGHYPTPAEMQAFADDHGITCLK